MHDVSPRFFLYSSQIKTNVVFHSSSGIRQNTKHEAASSACHEGYPTAVLFHTVICRYPGAGPIQYSYMLRTCAALKASSSSDYANILESIILVGVSVQIYLAQNYTNAFRCTGMSEGGVVFNVPPVIKRPSKNN